MVVDVDAILLDMDGTLVSSDAAVERAWTSWAAEQGLDPAAVLAIAHGQPTERTIGRMLPELSPEGVAEAAARLLALECDDLADIAPTEGVDRLVAVLERRALPWAVFTTARRRLAQVRLEAAGIEPPVLVTADDVTASKPDPEGYLRAARSLGVAPSRCLVVEDTEAGLAAGRAAGAMTAALKGLDGEIRLADLGQLADVLDEPSPRRAF
jgi:mannitol-1-/sugar-/sorbitol-6-phosphatase